VYTGSTASCDGIQETARFGGSFPFIDTAPSTGPPGHRAAAGLAGSAGEAAGEEAAQAAAESSQAALEWAARAMECWEAWRAGSQGEPDSPGHGGCWDVSRVEAPPPFPSTSSMVGTG
jgi:hypothetical protein